MQNKHLIMTDLTTDITGLPYVFWVGSNNTKEYIDKPFIALEIDNNKIPITISDTPLINSNIVIP